MNIIFGPVISRRFGTSLGIDLSPSHKQCNFDCLYCELAPALTIDKQEKSISVESIADELTKALNEHQNIDVITITANGEPTLYPYLDEKNEFINIIKDKKQMGQCPVIDKLLFILVDSHISSAELFTLCTNAKYQTIEIIFKNNNIDHNLYNAIYKLFDINFTGVLDKYYQTLLQKDIKINELILKSKVMDENVIYSKTDAKGVITNISKAFEKITGFTKDEIIGKTHSIIKDSAMPKEVHIDLWHTIKNMKQWEGEIRNKKKNGDFYWVNAKFEPEYNYEGSLIGYTALREDITSKKEIEQLTADLEMTVEKRTKELERRKAFVQTLLDSQEQLIITTNGEKLITANETFFDFFAFN